MCFFTSPRLLLKTIAQLFKKKKKKVLSGEEEEMKVFLPNHSAAQQRSLSRLGTPSLLSSEESLASGLILGAGYLSSGSPSPSQ